MFLCGVGFSKFEVGYLYLLCNIILDVSNINITYQHTKTYMLSVEEITERLGDRNLSEVARRCGLSFQCVWRIARERHGKVAYDTVKKLSDYLEQQ